MDVSLRTKGGHRVRIVERPGEWMEDRDLEALCADLRRIAAETLPADGLNYGVFAGDASTMKQVVITLVSRADGTPIAFNALVIMQIATVPAPTEVLHLGLVMIVPSERSQNLSWVLYGLTCFLILLRRQLRPIWVSNVTQVPAVVGMVSRMFSDVWPRPDQGRRSLTHLLLARRIMEEKRAVFGVGPDAEFDETRFVIKNAYTGGSDGLKKTFEEAPKHRQDAFNAFCAQELDYARGDDLLQLGRMDLAAMRTYLSQEVPKSALAGLLLTGAIVALRRVLLPVVYWADSTKRWSILRPFRDDA
ncbi:hypothetical protein SAMN04488515_1457 [Cognatiyoonia koreensis]|uniref:Uncharacterized protein n=2 Tax=Cognatiyoonia koreensis TaxID=364200 RepID=A0A1I0PV37_9RHOB|nr:hypothetical protein SAMN04488515_1457 [Cognatiyoonia koreensis]